MKKLILLGALCALSSACGSLQTQYDWEVNHKTGQTYLAGTHQVRTGPSGEDVARTVGQVIGTTLEVAANAAGAYAGGYNAAYQSSYQCRQPYFQQPYGTATAITFGPGQSSMTFIHY